MSVYSYMVTIFGIVFWVFRAVITIMYTSGIDVSIVPINSSIEIAVLFVTIPILIFVVKKMKYYWSRMLHGYLYFLFWNCNL